MEAFRPIEILLVEDSEPDARLAIEALKEAKVKNRVTVVEDGVEAMDFLYCRGKYSDCPHPDLILLDLNLPRKDGRQVLKEIKEDSRLRRIPVVVLTTSKAEEDTSSDRQTPPSQDPARAPTRPLAGEVVYLEKPAFAGELFSAISRTLGRAPARQEPAPRPPRRLRRGDCGSSWPRTRPPIGRSSRRYSESEVTRSIWPPTGSRPWK